ncbi:hypothetical protein A3A71_03035 [Candidatus Berkelbacteria bacterium RIFCSPLOWO2_01_FULL_50_28]|uniref:VWFA domain-containing protein n=1 Tax=Candidatus Berkelbacteria bacterium RIFCSPLOWO2_01_FULL_50_28 TaxID=1797471 RepID=A0A1F5ECL9_9BACT|nr:MAG: hypothetical protein A2807_02600 [Candidatus Berkelbacteria bacterium RIFCSPHIGHO2_01_FULL_50_36]OGD63767.1 MAG: hypothetical protein A3F39_03435 [Candidatus Berkelbacteria bacterium RIFCSPHIGHO2_12_FULL_50_11]OGD65040.1 MAG: hypothetical protein A3A71_03035 [Candidatus Berkelbacteria bacterium RIFCSPLOWO2_01_FULL_50_28]
MIGLDSTGSNIGKKNTYSGAAHAVLQQMPNAEFDITIDVFGTVSETRTLFEGVVNDPDDLAAPFNEYWNGTAPKKRGTYWQPMLAKVAKKSATSKVAVLLFTDGEIYDDKECELIIKQLAGSDNVVAVFIGPTIIEDAYGGTWRTKVERLFEPLGNRVFLCGPNDQQQKLDAFAKKVEKP